MTKPRRARPRGSPPAGFVSTLAAELAEDVLARFLRYVRIDTQAAYDSDAVPSTAKQLDLSRLLEAELRGLGLDDVALSPEGIVYASVPGTVLAPAVGLIAHVDTSPDVPGAGVRPLVHRAWDGSPIVLPGDPAQMLDPAESAELAARRGHDLVTSDGTTLLGADDKAGVAEIVAAVAYLLAHPERPRAPLRLAFTADEEIGRGAERFDLERFGAVAAYTLDGSGLGEIEIENFSAKLVTIAIHGVATHPGDAKGRLVNALKLAAELIASLPPELSPEATEGREGFLHPTRITGNADTARLHVFARDHDDDRLEQHVALLEGLARGLEQREPRARVTVEVREQYRNMRPVLDRSPQVVAAAEEACRRAGVEPALSLIRGGTDGAVLSARGLPTPNLFTGGQAYHSQKEWVSVQDMAAAAATVVELAGVWAEPRG